mmetsp:Transcript_3037/g.5221  ORF Transcript_3037/g.5221 Transcript_3037/m.5221 type:complete len:87 (+) Transcript_3037:2122-2382(+)
MDCPYLRLVVTAGSREMRTCVATMWPVIRQFPGLSVPKPQSSADTLPWCTLTTIRIDGIIGGGNNATGHTPTSGWNTQDVMPVLIM